MQRNRSAHTACLIANFTVRNEKHADFQLTKKCRLVERTLIKLQQSEIGIKNTRLHTPRNLLS